VALADLAFAAYATPAALPPGCEPGLEATARYAGPMFTFSNAAHACVAEVNLATGAVNLLRYAVSQDCGVMINPMVVEGQVAGGVVQGIGGALLEHVAYDTAGNPLTTTFLDYLPPLASDVPLLEIGHVTTPSTNPGGHKGMGEGGAIGAPAAVLNAVADALAPLGLRVTELPLSPDRLLQLIEDRR
jgi:carbon-monoxide dehydrogenase large subunit